MTRTPALMARQPPEILDTVLRMADTHTYVEIQAWLNAVGIHASYYQVCSFLKGSGASRYVWVVPASDQRTRVQQYGAALMAYEPEFFTIRNLGLRGKVWTMCSRSLLDAGLIESTRSYSPMQFRLMVPKVELGAWLEARRFDD